MPFTENSGKQEDKISHKLGSMSLQVWHCVFVFYQSLMLSTFEKDGLYFKFEMVVQDQIKEFQSWLRQGGNFVREINSKLTCVLSMLADWFRPHGYLKSNG